MVRYSIFPILLTVLLDSIVAAPARAQSAISECRIVVPAEPAITFAHSKHLYWYRRFWTGSCKNLSTMDFCRSGSPYWNEVVIRLGRDATPTQRRFIVNETCRLGHLIGFEWAKDNDKRCIHTRDLSALYAHLDSPGDPLARLARTKRAASSLLECRR